MKIEAGLLCCVLCVCVFFCFQVEDGIRELVRSRGLGDVYKRQACFCVNFVEIDQFVSIWRLPRVGFEMEIEKRGRGVWKRCGNSPTKTVWTLNFDNFLKVVKV